MRGKFITFEGGEGAGKSTQARRLAEHVRAGGIEVVETREPGGTPFAERVRRLVLSPVEATRSPLAEALLFSAARADHLASLIRPTLARGGWVVSDRFADSTRVYQGAAGGLDAGAIDTLERLVVADTVPDLTFLLDLDPAVGLARATRRRSSAATADAGGADGYEARALAFHQQLRRGFLELARATPDRFVVLDAVKSPEVIAEEVSRAVAERLGGA